MSWYCYSWLLLFINQWSKLLLFFQVWSSLNFLGSSFTHESVIYFRSLCIPKWCFIVIAYIFFPFYEHDVFSILNYTVSRKYFVGSELLDDYYFSSKFQTQWFMYLQHVPNSSRSFYIVCSYVKVVKTSPTIFCIKTTLFLCL